ncbi:pectate lyase family protein [Massilia consociata]|uniref:Polysaccharide lyase family 1 protein n=1 Tax=Massilia consociata TaxID=760117 RepID=A0ABV6FH65_9BURK
MRFSMRAAILTMTCWCLPATAAEPFIQLSGMSRAGIDVKGWADTRGGAGGRIIRVTNLNASGEGSFAAAVAQTGARIVVFEVGGVIDLQGASIRVQEPHLTIAGQTAPNPGITFIRGEFSVATHDVIVQHIAVRPGEFGRAKRSGWEADGLSTSAADNVIIDHCSFSWATDENLSASGPRFKGATVDEWRQATSRRITFSHNIVAEGLRDSTHRKGEHSKGSLVHDNANRVLFFGNLFNANHERNPLIKGGAHVAVVNNLIHDFGARAVHYNLIAHEWGGQPAADRHRDAGRQRGAWRRRFAGGRAPLQPWRRG